MKLSACRPPGRQARAARLLLIALLFVPALTAGRGGAAIGRQGRGDPVGEPSRAQTSAGGTIYLPLILGIDRFAIDTPIWSHAGPPAASEVALFRHSFSLAAPLSAPTLALFADTRYEVWLDGAWLGRGPARFSRQTHEYDVYPLQPLGAGQHLIAVLVQWAPNVRRSESTAPSLQAHIQQGDLVAARSGAGWKALRSAAWREDAAPVHAWRLIGPTELLDLRQLPQRWNQPDFADAGWPSAVAAAATQAIDQPRSIAQLANIPMPAVVREVGALSPGRAIADIAAAGAQSISLTALADTTLTVETLAVPDAATAQTIRLDGGALGWRSSDGRPDVLVASRPIAAGAHALSFSGPPQGITFSISRSGIAGPNLPIQQGSSAGRRVLLAEPVAQPGAVAVSYASGVDLTFKSTPAYAVLDLGRVVHGRVSASVSGPAGTLVDMGWDERLWRGTRPLPYPGSLHTEWNQTDSWALDGSTRAITTIDARAGRYLLIAAWGPGTVRLSNLQVSEERYPVEPRGRFSSSDPLLDRIWQVGVNTLYPNMTDAYADPWRERGQWWGDAYVDDHVNEAAFGDSQLLARGLRLMSEGIVDGQAAALAPNGSDTHLIDYGMLWVQSLSDYERRTGDALLPARVYPPLRSLMQSLEQRENATSGLLDLPYDEWWRTALVDWPAFYSRYGQSTALNALYYETLRSAARIADSVGDLARGAAWRQKADALKRAINSRLYLPAEGRYISSILDGKPLPPTPHAQAWALAFDIAPEQDRQRIADELVASLSADPTTPNVDIYGMFWVLEGLGRAGRIADANEIIRRYYGSLLDRGATTWWERFNSDKTYQESLSHAWGAAPTWFLTTYVLGARRIDPQTWALHPQPGGLARVAGALPLAAGTLQASWEAIQCGANLLTLDAPGGTQGEALVPYNDDATVLTLDGVVIWRDGAPLAPGVVGVPGGVRVALAGGRHRLQVQHQCFTTYLTPAGR